MTTLPEPPITVSPEYLGGEPVFTGTRVPVQALFDYIEGGDPLDEFLDDFPGCLPRARHSRAVKPGDVREITA